MKLHIPDELADAILIQSLTDCYLSHKECNRPSYGIYSKDEAEDFKEMAKMRKAIKRVLSWYTTETELPDD